MLERAQTQTYAPASRRLLSPGPASNCSSLVTRHYFIQSLAKHNRKPSQIIENNRQRPKSIASFCRVLCAYSDGQPTFSRQPTLNRAPAAPPSQAAHRSILLLSKRQASQLEPSPTYRKHSPTLRSNREKKQGSHGSHDNIQVRLLLLDTPSGTVCTGFDQGCKDRARKPFLAVIQ